MQNRYSKLIVAAFLLLQFAILIIFGYTPYPDCGGYIAAAREALSQGSPYPSPQQLYDMEFIWNLGSINAVELSLWLSGSILPLLIVYTLLKGLTAWLVYDLTCSLAEPETALVALIIYVLYPANYGEATAVLSELPFIFFSLLALWLALSRHKLLLSGISLAVANWFRPMGVVFLLALIVVLLYGYKNKKGEKSREDSKQRTFLTKPFSLFVYPILGYLLTILVIGGVTKIYSGKFIYQAQTGWMALMQYSWDNDSDQESDKHLFYQGNPMAIADSKTTDGTERNDYWQHSFKIWISNGNLGEYVRQMPKKLVNTFISDNVNMCTFVTDKQQKEYIYGELSLPSLAKSFPHLSEVQWLTVANLLFYYALLLLWVVSLCYIRQRETSAVDVLALAVVLLGTLVLLFVGHGEARFHQPFMPFIIMAVAHLCVYYKTRKKI